MLPGNESKRPGDPINLLNASIQQGFAHEKKIDRMHLLMHTCRLYFYSNYQQFPQEPSCRRVWFFIMLRVELRSWSPDRAAEPARLI